MPIENSFVPASSGKVSVVVVNWNHIQYLPDCLEAIINQSYSKFDITVVDNASQDNSLESISSISHQVHVIQLDSNYGFSKAFNIGVKATTGEFVLSLNPDVKAQPDFIKELVQEAQIDETIGIIAPKLLRADDPQKLDSTGLFINRQRRPYDRGQMKFDSGEYDHHREIFGACGAAALFRRTMLEDLDWRGEYFDEDFFAYYEDIDLAWRARSKGWRCIYAPKAIAEHARGWGDTLRKHQDHKLTLGPRLALRNRYLMLIKNDSLLYFFIDLPWIAGSEIPRFFYMLIFRRGALGAVGDFLHLAPKAWQKRQSIFSNRKVPPSNLRHWFSSTVR
jgi:GT2 family glycosyltransferase